MYARLFRKIIIDNLIGICGLCTEAPFIRLKTSASFFQWLVARTLGNIPGPILYGFALDQACYVWGTSCGEQGSCNVYNNNVISRNVFIVSLVLKVRPSFGAVFAISFLFYFQMNAACPTCKIKDGWGLLRLTTTCLIVMCVKFSSFIFTSISLNLWVMLVHRYKIEK